MIFLDSSVWIDYIPAAFYKKHVRVVDKTREDRNAILNFDYRVLFAADNSGQLRGRRFGHPTGEAAGRMVFIPSIPWSRR